ncbi:unnamed protein product [Arctogadus glacialis]
MSVEDQYGESLSKGQRRSSLACFLIPLRQRKEVDCKQEAVGASEEVSYATVHFKRNTSRSAPGPEHEIVYSEVVG